MNQKLNTIRKKCGSLRAFARLCKVSERMAWYWVKGERTSKPLDDRFRSLAA